MPGSALSSLSDASAPDESGSGASSSFADDETALADIACADSESARESGFSTDFRSGVSSGFRSGSSSGFNSGLSSW